MEVERRNACVQRHQYFVMPPHLGNRSDLDDTRRTPPIAFEHEGRFEEAKQAYEKALQLDPKNLLIRQNYDLFNEINDRTKRRRAR